MRILWFTNILLPPAAEAMGLAVTPTGGWMLALLQAIRKASSDLQITVLTTHRQHFRVEVGGVTYATFGDPRRLIFNGRVPLKIELEAHRLVSECNPDLIHIHGTEFFYARLGHEALCHKPTLVSLQGVINGYYPHYSGHLTAQELRPYTKWLRRLLRGDSVFGTQQQWRGRRSTQERGALSRHNHIAGRTQWDRAWVAAYNPTATYHHLDEIMRPEFYTVQREADAIRPYSVYCSAAAGSPLKGLHWVLRAAGFLKSRYPEIQVRVANAEHMLTPPRGVLGRLKDRTYPSYLRNLIRELGLAENVVGLPSLTAAEVAEELRRAHLFCLPSLCENSPNSLGEAMLTGTPSVATYVGGVPSMLTHEEEGLLCPPGDPAALAATLDRMFADDGPATAMAARARKTARERHDAGRIAAETLRIYADVLAPDGGLGNTQRGRRGAPERITL